ncbi:hypothetical protein F441_01220 [Phytophthora nicotianae CJ01A1]|uniref:Uncharacterized protein n=1 Tax=Phytophthora nicotianae CJ01A1 TaxID=1317063 RepID=W2XUA0_PHYNI|nr:hypothetical protein F441_01220 [Phytophthora nicotianae CJ01A1]
MAPRVALPAPASTPVGMPMAAIPSYGDVTIQVPSTSRNDGGDGAARHAPAAQAPTSMGGLGLGRSYSGQGGGYQTQSANWNASKTERADSGHPNRVAERREGDRSILLRHRYE